MEKSRIESYADLLISTGLNVQKGQTVVISCPVDCAYFARLCASAAYKLGCREVIMNWTDDFLSREKYLYAENSVFDEVHTWVADMRNSVADMAAAWLSIYSEDPEALSGVDPDRIKRTSAASGKALKNFRDKQMVNFFPWCVASVPTKAWAKKVFPDKSDDDAMEALWESILSSSRVYKNGDPVLEWQKLNAERRQRVLLLNSYKFKYLKYKNSLGTDLTIQLPDTHVWAGGSEMSRGGIEFNPNIPTEEIFTSPLREGVNGIVYASRPLVVNGSIANNFSFTFENGKITKITAENGKELLESATTVDDGASFLGEVALVPYDSPISNSGILFFNTLFDENASCHLAFGDSYPCVEGGEHMTREDLSSLGLNSSIMHEDFMVGTKDLSITGITHDGKEIPVFTDGNFAF